MKINNLIIILLLIIIAILSFICIYLFTSKNTTNTVQQQPIIIEKRNEELPMYPKENPKYHEQDYQQIGTLSSIDNSKILPLFGKRLNKDRWLYYSASETNNQLKIDIEYENKKCKDKYIGCNELYDDDIVTIPQYNNEKFIVSKYDYKTFEYSM
jgi:hypothetical protein